MVLALGLGVVAIVGLAAVGTLLADRAILDSPTAQRSQPAPEAVVDPADDSGIVHPTEWDPRIVEIVEFVERQRGLAFEHPVAIDFLPEDEFVATVTVDPGELTEEDVEQVRRSEGHMRSLGLLSPGVESDEELRRIQETTLIAYYSPETESVSVKGTELTPAVRAIVAHELVHVLQDQHFDLEAYMAPEDPDAIGRRMAVVEGDAVLIQQAYMFEELTAGERGQVYDDELEVLESFEADGGGDFVLGTLLSLPYMYGPSFVDLVGIERGWEGVNDLFASPLASDAQLLSPELYFQGVGPEPVEAPLLPDGAELIHEGEMGSFSWLIVFAPDGTAEEVLGAVDGWAGDRYSVYELDGRVCTSAALYGRDSAATDQLAALSSSWADALAAGGAQSARTGDRSLEIASCDPGADAPAVQADAIDEVIQAGLSRVMAAG